MRFTLRIVLIVLALALIGLALAPKASPAAALAAPDPLPYTSVIRIGGACDTCGPVACAGRLVPVHLEGVLPNDCQWSFLRVELAPNGSGGAAPPIVRVRVADNEAIDCGSMAPRPWSADTFLPGLPAGDYVLTVQMAVASNALEGDSTYSVERPFAVRAACPTATDTILPFVSGLFVGGSAAHSRSRRPSPIPSRGRRAST